jgi:hypothetical protein
MTPRLTPWAKTSGSSACIWISWLMRSSGLMFYSVGRIMEATSWSAFNSSALVCIPVIFEGELGGDLLNIFADCTD